MVTDSLVSNEFVNNKVQTAQSIMNDHCQSTSLICNEFSST
jgi:hypothetical protein